MSKVKDPAILFYTADFLLGTMLMTAEDVGWYIRLLCVMHQQGRMSEQAVSTFLHGNISDAIREKFEIDENGFWYNPRLEDEISKRLAYKQSRMDNLSKVNKVTHINDHKDNHKDNHKGDHTHPQVVNVNDNVNENEDKDNKEEVVGGEKEGKDVTFEDVIDAYHRFCPQMNKVVVLNRQRRGYINARMNEYGFDKIIEVLQMSGKNSFLNGDNEKGWRADFDWIMKPTNFVKIVEGRYNNRKKKSAFEERRDKFLKEFENGND